MISIYDPVSCVYNNLDSNTKTAHKMTAPRMPSLKGDMNAPDGDESVGTTSRIRNVDKLNLKATDSSEAGAVVGAVISGDSISAGGNAVAWSSNAEINQESLSTQTIEGVEVEGTRVTITIPAGKIGNDRPIVTVNERWYSPELQVIVLSKNSDPRMGETTYRLTNIVRIEPDPSPFQVPADYRVEETGFDLRTGHPEPSRRVERFERVRRPNDN
jgi:hypothetical protein